MAKRGAPVKQPSVIKALKVIGENYGYKVQARGKDPKRPAGQKKFLPDIIAVPFKGKERRCMEVEATVTNNTIFKSLVSLLDYLSNYKDASAYLVVRSKDRQFAEDCRKEILRLIRHFGKTVRGANPKIRLTVATFEEVMEANKKIVTWDTRGRTGAPPKCSFLPRCK